MNMDRIKGHQQTLIRLCKGFYALRVWPHGITRQLGEADYPGWEKHAYSSETNNHERKTLAFGEDVKEEVRQVFVG